MRYVLIVLAAGAVVPITAWVMTRHQAPAKPVDDPQATHTRERVEVQARQIEELKTQIERLRQQGAASPAQDVELLLAAMAMLERRGDHDGLGILLRSLRRLDADRYYVELERLVRSGVGERSGLFNDGENTDRRMIPVLKAMAETGGERGSSGGYRQMQLAQTLAQFDSDELQPYLTECVRQWLDSSRENSLDVRGVRALVASGLPQAHLAVLRWVRGQNYGNGEQRERAWNQISDAYLGAWKFPTLAFEERSSDGKLSAEQRAAVQSAEQWIAENRDRLTWDRSKRRMILLPEGQTAPPPPRPPVREAPSKPSPTAAPAPTPAKPESKPDPNF